MAKAKPLNVFVEAPGVAEKVESILREEHGAHGLRLIGRAALESGANQKIDLSITQDQELGSLTFRYREESGETFDEKIEENGPSLERALSIFSLEKLTIPLHDQTSRDDFIELSKYSGDQPKLDADPSTWITNNSFVKDLCRRSSKYGNLVRYLCNERGLFLKVGNLPAQRAYWNSTTNGGLPVFRKQDPTHEGTFMLHDMFHFVPVDPLIGSESINNNHKAAYIAHRLLSEATTLVLADMIAVDDAELEQQGYDVSRRKIYPLYKSIKDRDGKPPELDKLLAANTYFCFTGNPLGFVSLGASDEAIAAYREKYEAIFRDDFMWNLHNFDAMVSERDKNPLLGEYYQWLETNTDIPTISNYENLFSNDRAELDIATMLSLFRGEFNKALGYSEPISNARRTKLAYQKYLAGQRIVFARFGDKVNPAEYLEAFDEHFTLLKESGQAEDAISYGEVAKQVINDYILRVQAESLLLPHDMAMYVFSAPLYPVKFVNYERNRTGASDELSNIMQHFINLNRQQLKRLLEAIVS